MRNAANASLALVATVLVCAPSTVFAASFNCSARGLSRAEVMICADPQLSRTDEQLATRTHSIGRRMNFGQYLGLRHWQAMAAKQRDACSTDRTCIAAHYRAQRRLLDRVQQCLDTRFARRACLRNSLAVERDQETMRR